MSRVDICLPEDNVDLYTLVYTNSDKKADKHWG